ncbi:protein TUNICAMYCIN INDUCED 1 [Humulus lupulus]|uniref:protein TUNICAMYCIN INDUCED 1 n=1 Tax=Humulus lupulus TaxID=3486 RepID=UPI002B4130BC|nr:protein TUNICAMYCIN INDUCED 1 [Humulus lupulus]
MTMMNRLLPKQPPPLLLLLLLIVILLLQQSFVLAFTSSPNAFSSSNDTLLLQDVLNQISTKLSWGLDDIKVSRLDLKKLRFGAANRYVFRVGLGKSRISANFSDDVTSWKKFRKPRSHHFGYLLNNITSLTLLDTFQVEGPFELRVGAFDNPSLFVPVNRTHAGFNRIIVGEGITVEVRKAREVSAFHASNLSIPVNGSNVTEKEKSEFLPIWHSFCRPLMQIQVFGSPELVAYRTRNPYAYIETNFISKDTIELLADKCYGSQSHTYKKRDCPIDSLSSGISMLEKVLRSYFGKRLNGLVGLFRGNIKASALIRFQLELEKNLRSNRTDKAKDGWRTMPTVERVLFEVVARVEAERLKLLIVKEVEPFAMADTVAWSNLSNISFTKFPSLLVPSEALTLDVKW